MALLATLFMWFPALGEEAQDEQAPAERGEFTTDFSQHSVPYEQIISGGPPKDGIPAIDAPQFVTVEEADGWLAPEESVVFHEIGEDARAYPVRILMFHEIVNDTVGGVPVAVTYCPLCNTAIVFGRSVDDRVLDFGTSGRLRYSNLVMYDRQTETWWQQATGEAIAGELTGHRLAMLPAPIVSWSQFRDAHPGGTVLAEPSEGRPYGRNPYVGYDDPERAPFLYRSAPATPEILPAVARVLAVEFGEEKVAYPYTVLSEVGVVNDTVAGKQIVVLWTPGTASPLDAETVAGGRDIGSAGAFSRELGGRILTFAQREGRIVDEETGSIWSILGRGIDGELTGRRLEQIVAVEHFWFSWAAHNPNTRVYQLDD